MCVGQLGYSNGIAPYNNGSNLPYFNIGVGGGGATSITITNRGILKNFNSFRDEVLLVGGGGGSNEWVGEGGVGGYPSGGIGSVRKWSKAEGGSDQTGNVGSGGTQSSGGTTDYITYGVGYSSRVNGSFGQGGYGELNGDYGEQGGGGWYGGGGASYAGASGGGSSYYNKDKITQFAYKNGVNGGNGRAKISWAR